MQLTAGDGFLEIVCSLWGLRAWLQVQLFVRSPATETFPLFHVLPNKKRCPPNSGKHPRRKIIVLCLEDGGIPHHAGLFKSLLGIHTRQNPHTRRYQSATASPQNTAENTPTESHGPKANRELPVRIFWIMPTIEPNTSPIKSATTAPFSPR